MFQMNVSTTFGKIFALKSGPRWCEGKRGILRSSVVENLSKSSVLHAPMFFACCHVFTFCHVLVFIQKFLFGRIFQGGKYSCAQRGSLYLNYTTANGECSNLMFLLVLLNSFLFFFLFSLRPTSEKY